ncbi:MAG: sigma 54-interacting transcriptional regulator [Candidatus Eiseniibacteriota bacterium]|nr:MAG: sigma 54-interacting transcriptional regulator [Candidatus Eisenbacteria bacterium]
MDPTKQNLKDIQKLREQVAELEEELRKQSQELAESRRFTDEVAASNPGMTYVADLDSRSFVHVSGNVLELTGYTADEILAMGGHVLEALIHPDHLPLLYQQIEMLKTVANHEILSSEMMIRREDGTCAWVYRFSKVFRRAPDGTVKQTIGTLVDVTERKAAERSLQFRESVMKAIVETTREWIWEIDVEGIHTFCNPAIEAILGYAPSELVGRCSLDFLHEEDRKTVEAQLPKWIAAREGWSNLVLRWRHKDGTYRLLESNGVPILDEKGNVSGFRGVDRDVTERRKAEEALRKEQEFSKRLVDNSRAFFVLIDRDFKTRMMNESMLRALGYSRNEVEGVDYLSRFVPERDREPLSRIFDILVGRGETTLNENHVLTRAGRELLVEWRGCPLKNEQGEVELFFGTGIDITERRRAETELQEAFDEIRRLKDQLEADNVLLRQDVQIARGHERIVGVSSAMKLVMRQMEQVAATDSTVLLLGETGTGKELVARGIHEMSARKERAFVAVNCAAVPSTLVESELFGREKGAYTGALTRQTGRFEVADGSTIFLDEIGDLSLEAQAKLLRVLEEGQFERLGSSRTVKVDVRVIAATNRNLSAAVEEGRFRRDLFYRLNVFPISIPPLRQHPEDIPSLVWHFLNEFNVLMGRQIESISQGTMDRLRKYSWPGNVRELRNVIERAMILATGPTLRVEIPVVSGPSERELRTLEECQRGHILAALEKTGWRVRGRQGAAELLGLKPSTLESKMVKLGIRRARASTR